jgi:hypothetical protein
MTKTKLFGAAFIALAATAGAAHAQQQGSVGLSYQSTDFGSGELETATINGALQFNDNLQVNARYADFEGGDANAWGIDGFLSTRNDSYGYGAFLGYSSFESDADEWSIGGFGQLYRGNTNWTAQLGYSDTEGDLSIIHLDGEGRFFISENFSVQANLGYGDIDSDFGGDDYWTGGVGAEWQIPGSHVSVNGGWQRVEFDGGETDTLGAGVRFHFDGGSLIDRSRSGASLRRNTPTALDLELGGGNAGFVPR